MKTALLVFVSIVFLIGSAPDAAFAGTQVESQAASWCQAKPGDTRERLMTLMGEPKYSLETQMTWLAPPLSFYAFLDANGTAKQLDINTGSLNDAQKAALPCAATRTRRSMLLAAKQVPVHTTIPACQLVSAAEMSVILGAPVFATSDDRPPASTRCTYKPASGISPQVELTFNWGDGAAAMSGLGLAEKREPGLVSPFGGMGDQAGVAGPALLIRTGEDLVTMVFAGVAGVPAKAKRIFDTAKARM
ncbi:MAG: hypothetical protein ABI145_02865 [Steroidobacteraceae bacterium]